MVIVLIALLFNTSFGQVVQPPVDPNQLKEKLNQGVDSSNRRELTEDELMQKYFNKRAKPKAKLGSEFKLPVYYEGMRSPLVQIKAKGNEQLTGLTDVQVDAKAIVLILTELADKNWLSKLDHIKSKCEDIFKKEKKDEKTVCWEPISAFEDPDVNVILNEKLLEIRIRIKPEFRSVKVTTLRSYANQEDRVTDEPSWFSSIINLNLKETFNSNKLIYKNGREPYLLNLNLATRFGGFLLEANGYTREKLTGVPSNEPSFARTNVTGIVDFESISARSQIGDITYPVDGYQIYRPMAGLSFFTQSTLKSSIATAPGDSYELNLLRPSKIKIFINDRVIQILELPAGRHNLRDFPFIQGENNLKIEITDDLGRTEAQDYSLFVTNKLLKPSQHQYSYSAGIPSTDTNGVRSYDSEKTTISAFHRYGYSSKLTLGANIQVDPFQSVSGFEFSFVSKKGYYTIEPALSLNKNNPSGFAAKLNYTIQDIYGEEKNKVSTNYEAIYTSEHFSRLGTLLPTNQTALTLKAAHSRGLSNKSNVNLGIDYNFSRSVVGLTSISDSYSFTLGAGRVLGNGFNTFFSLRQAKTTTGDSLSFLVTLLWTPPKERQFLSLSSSSSSSTTRADWTNMPVDGVGGLKSNVNIISKPSGNAYGLGLDYLANRYTVLVNHQVEVQKEDLTVSPPVTSTSLSSTALNLGTALVFANGKFAITRPVYDSFIIFSPLDNLDDETVMVNPQKNGTYTAETDWLGAAVYSELPSYTVSDIELKSKVNKLGISLPRDHFTLKPKYRSGYAVIIGTEATVYLKSKLIIQNSEGASMLSGRAVYLDDKNVEPVAVFTNRKGLLRSEGFRRGRYRLEVSSEDLNYEPVEFLIPEDAPDEFELAPIQLKEIKDEKK